MTATEYLKEQGIHPIEPIYWYCEDEIITLEQLLENYHQAKLKLLGITDNVRRSEQLKCQCKKAKFTRTVDADFNPICGRCGKAL